MYKAYNETQRDPRTKDRYDEEWSRIRNEYIITVPFCEMCRKYGKLVRAVEVHHIRPLAEGGSNDFTNLISLCRRCHAKIHADRGDYKTKKVYTY